MKNILWLTHSEEALHLRRGGKQAQEKNKKKQSIESKQPFTLHARLLLSSGQLGGTHQETITFQEHRAGCSKISPTQHPSCFLLCLLVQLRLFFFFVATHLLLSILNPHGSCFSLPLHQCQVLILTSILFIPQQQCCEFTAVSIIHLSQGILFQFFHS